MQAGLAVEGATMNFGPVGALRNCSFAVPRGSVCALVGLNGSGKTTVLRAAAGLLRLDSGSISVEETTVAFARPGALSYLAQGKPLHAVLRPGEVVAYARALASGNLNARLAAEWLARYEVPLNQRVGELSGGQRTQVALAVAVARGGSAVALDEPVADLDPLAREQVAQDLRAQARGGRTVVVSSHAVAELSGWCDYLVVLDRGQVILQGTVQQLAADGEVAAVVLSALRSARAARLGGQGAGEVQP